MQWTRNIELVFGIFFEHDSSIAISCLAIHWGPADVVRHPSEEIIDCVGVRDDFLTQVVLARLQFFVYPLRALL